MGQRFLPSLVIVLLLSGCFLPSDKALINTFSRDKEPLEQLVTLIYDGLDGVEQDKGSTHTEQNLYAYLAAQENYTKRLKAAHVEPARLWTGYSEDSSTAVLLPKAETFPMLEKGFAYFPTEPNDSEIFIVEDIDKFELPRDGTHYVALRHLEGNWYLYLENLS